MASSSNELEELVRQNLELRRELAAEIARADGASQGGGIAYRFGWVLYWACFGLAVLWVTVWIARFFTDFAPLPWVLHVLLFWLPALTLYGLGHAFRYVLSGN
jgi:hypothetical protein